MTSNQTLSRKHWLWVTRPKYYLNKDGSDRDILEPEHVRPAWWTCHGDTREGDFILLYRTAPEKNIAYWIEAYSKAYKYKPKSSHERNWKFVCDYRVLRKFANPLALKELRSDPVMRSWWPLRRNFQGIVFQIAPEYWQRLIELLAAKNSSCFDGFVDVNDECPPSLDIGN